MRTAACASQKRQSLGDAPIDFTWEREWRIATDQLAITPSAVRLIVPNHEAAEELESRHDVEELQSYEERVLAYGEVLAGYEGPMPFPWQVEII